VEGGAAVFEPLLQEAATSPVTTSRPTIDGVVRRPLPGRDIRGTSRLMRDVPVGGAERRAWEEHAAEV